MNELSRGGHLRAETKRKGNDIQSGSERIMGKKYSSEEGKRDDISGGMQTREWKWEVPKGPDSKD